VLSLVGATFLVVAALALAAGVALHGAALGAPLVAAGFDVFNALVTVAGVGFGTSVAAAAISGARSGALSTGLLRAAAAVVPLQLLTLPGMVAEQGPFAAGGLVAIVAFWALSAWYVAASVHLLRRAPSRSATLHG
jgi:hypothetical protein